MPRLDDDCWGLGPADATRQRAGNRCVPQAVLDRYCITCHNQRLRTGGLTLDTVNAAKPADNGDLWERVIAKLRAGSMPPPGSPRPDTATYRAVANWLETEIDRAWLMRPKSRTAGRSPPPQPRGIRGERVVEGRGRSGFQQRTDVTTALMAAVGMGGGGEWVELERSEREALMLDAVKLAIELGVDVNAANTDGRTALDAAKASKYDRVVAFLLEKGAKGGG